MSVSVIVVDDGSSDQTARIARNCGAAVIRHMTNLGVGAATRTGFEAASLLAADVVVTMDGDGQHDPADIERLVQCLVEERLDIAVGNRLGELSGMPPYRVVANILMNLVTFAAYGRYVPDSQSGFKAMTGMALARMELNGIGYEICSEIIGEIRYRNLRCKFVPVRAIYSDYSREKGQVLLNGVNVVLHMFSRLMRRV